MLKIIVIRRQIIIVQGSYAAYFSLLKITVTYKLIVIIQGSYTADSSSDGVASASWRLLMHYEDASRHRKKPVCPDGQRDCCLFGKPLRLS
jgi:hypothetical protein